jgi:hypothetical protein
VRAIPPTTEACDRTSVLLSQFPVLFTIGVGRVASGSGLDVDINGQSEARENGACRRLERIAPTAFSIASGQLSGRRRGAHHDGLLWCEGIGRRDCGQRRSTEGSGRSHERPLLHRQCLVGTGTGHSHRVLLVENLELGTRKSDVFFVPPAAISRARRAQAAT